MLLFSDEQIDRMVSRGPRNMLAGIAIIVILCCMPRGWRVGAFTGFMIFLLGLYSWGMRRRREEPGIWMAGALAAVLQGICWGLFEYMHLAHVLGPVIGGGAGAQPAGPLRERAMLAVDFTLALIVYGITVRFWATIAVRNWQLTRSPTGELGGDPAQVDPPFESDAPG